MAGVTDVTKALASFFTNVVGAIGDALNISSSEWYVQSHRNSVSLGVDRRYTLSDRALPCVE